MDSRERMNRMLRREDHDRIPLSEAFWPETIARWKREGMVGDPKEHLGDDVQRLCWSWPRPFPGKRQVIAQDDETETVIDDQGNTVRLSRLHSSTPEHVAFGCTTREQWFETYRPALLEARSLIDLPAAHENLRTGRAKGKWMTLKGIEPITGVHQLLGDETALIAEADDLEWIADVAKVYTDLILRDFQSVLDAGIEPDGMWVYGDLAFNHGPFFSPATYRELFAPQHKRMVDWAHERGLLVIYHTDGDYRMLMEDMLATGIDCLQPLEAKAGMDLRELSPKYGRRVSFMGNIDMTIASTNDLERIEAEVRSKLAAGMATKGYAYHSDHSVPPDVSWATYQHIIKLVDSCGRYA